MKIIYFITSRLIKVLANSTKVISYICHLILPNKRFIIPENSKPLIRSSKNKKIPRIFWQTNYSNKVTLPVYFNYLFNRLMSPTYEYRYRGSQSMIDFIKENYPKEILESYLKLNIGAAQADFWRVLILNKYGGVYMDIDAHLVWPLEYIVRSEYEKLYVITRPHHYTNYFLASVPENPDMAKVIEIIHNNIKSAQFDSVYELTGPPNINMAIDGQDVPSRSHRYTCVQGSFTNEYFQYLDKPKGKWIHAKKKDLLKK